MGTDCHRIDGGNFLLLFDCVLYTSIAIVVAVVGRCMLHCFSGVLHVWCDVVAIWRLYILPRLLFIALVGVVVVVVAGAALNSFSLLYLQFVVVVVRADVDADTANVAAAT